MARLPDSPLDEPVLPPLDVSPPRWWKWGMIGTIIVGLVAISPVFIRESNRCKGAAEEVNNLRQIGLALFEFETEYGRFPDETTIDAVKQKNGAQLRLGTKTSNDFFRQLLASGIAQTETMFYAKAEGYKKPDNDFVGNQALKKR